MVQIATLPLMLKQLRLSSIARHWQALLGKAERNGWDNAQYLAALCEQELADRLRNLPGTEWVQFYGEPREEITVTLDPAAVADGFLSGQGTQQVPEGSVEDALNVGDRTYRAILVEFKPG